ncbi:FAD-dependent oxidoreductase [Bacteroidales bacterium MSK.15.36]|nr:FAD-dependent oxidoreductase [Bacteroidales bacterium MSK.15.36]
MAKNYDQKICIVGGGPAGISAAWYLQEKGYKDITVLERLDRLGGKCNSPVYRGKKYEMGALMGVPNYHLTNELMEVAGVKADGPRLNRKFYSEEDGSEIKGISEEEMPKLKAQMKKMGELLATKYKGYTDPGYLNVHPDLTDTFFDFCMKNEIPLVMKVMINPFTSFGYGYFNLVPAAYVLKYLDFETLMNFVNINLVTWSEGTQDVWEKLALKLDRHPKLCTHINKVIRKDGKVYVYTNMGKEEYDSIIFTSPLQDLPSYIDVTEEEETLFSKIKYQDYKVLAATVENYPEISGYIPGNMKESRAGHVMVYYHRWKDEPEQIITFYVLGNPQDKVDEADCKRLILEDAERFGIKIKDIIMFKSWRYMPHVNCDQMKKGWHKKVEDMQGQMGTYYAGEVMSFGNIEETVCYSKFLVDRFF